LLRDYTKPRHTDQKEIKEDKEKDLVIGRVSKGNRRDHNIVRVSSFASKELSWHKRRCVV